MEQQMVSAVTSHQDWVGPCLLPQRWLRHQQLTAMDDNNTDKKKGSLTCVYKKLSSCSFVLDVFRRNLGQRWAVAGASSHAQVGCMWQSPAGLEKSPPRRAHQGPISPQRSEFKWRFDICRC